MIKHILRKGALSLLAATVACAPSQLLAQATNKPASAKAVSSETKETPKEGKKPGAGPFHGKLAALDKIAKTITVGKRTFQITSETKIKKSGKPATLEDGVVGEEVSGYVKPTPEGKLLATTLNFGPKTDKADTKGGEKQEPAEKAKK
jgi:hypothetical protein